MIHVIVRIGKAGLEEVSVVTQTAKEKKYASSHIT